MMSWASLLSARRIGKDKLDPVVPFRSPFEIDADRITFTSAFRRLADKMQVHGPSGTAYVRTRLTHSLEVSRVGRTLGALVGRDIVRNHLQGTEFDAADIGHIVSAAALAHDIGNPPFGHTGEDIISDFFAKTDFGQKLIQPLSARERAEFTTFEGNAQGFRIVATLQGWRPQGGLQLTAATLGAFTKYPWAAEHRTAKGKYGFRNTEAAAFAAVAEATGLLPGEEPARWCRHPLAFLVEASDDLCYSVVDLEDGVKMGCLSFAEYEELLAPIARRDKAEYSLIETCDQKLVYLRSQAISNLVDACARAFLDNQDSILAGRCGSSLAELTDHRDDLKTIAAISRKRIYHSDERNRMDLVAANAINRLLENWCHAFFERELGSLSHQSKLALRLFPNTDQVPEDRLGWLNAVVDHIGGMTDRFCLEQSKLFLH